jgi:hypothetical protein
MIDNRVQTAVNRLARDHWTQRLEIGAVDTIVLIGFLQLALKHPTLTPVQRTDLQGMINRLASALCDREPALRELVNRGMPAGMVLPTAGLSS